MNMKKFLALGLLVSTTAAFALHDSEYNGDPEGWRWGVGARAGVAAFNGRLNSTETLRNVTTAADQSQRAIVDYIGITSFQGGLFFEGAYRWCDWSLGFLVDANGDTLKKDFLSINDTNLAVVPNQVNSDLMNLKSPVHVGGDIRGGAYWGNALLYLLVGGEAIRYEYTHTRVLQQAPFSVAAPVTVGGTADKFWRGAVRAGVGIEYNISDCFKLGLEYRFIWAGQRTQANIVHDTVVDAVTYRNTISDVLNFRQHVTALTFAYMF